jgi:hypothetical protein
MPKFSNGFFLSCFLFACIICTPAVIIASASTVEAPKRRKHMEDEIRPGYTRVSTILDPLYPKAGIPEEVLQNKCRIGDEVHRAIFLHASGFPTLLSPDAQPYFDSFLRWEESSQMKIVLKYSEQRYYDNQWMITGKIDALVNLPEEEQMVMCDWKTTSSYTDSTKLSWRLQGNFYRYLLERNEIPNVHSKLLFVQLLKDGKKPRVREIEYTQDNLLMCRLGVQYYRHYEDKIKIMEARCSQ